MFCTKQINNSISFFSKTVLFCCALCIQSCSDDEETLNVDSQITFANITPAMNVWNSVPISLDVSDDKGIATVEVRVDGVTLTTLTVPPFATSWDASNAEDGVHSIKVIVTDKSGNKTEKETTVTVQNALVTINIADDQLAEGEDYDERGFVFLSDENGNVIASTEYANGHDVVFKSSTFTGTKFFLTEVLAEGHNEKTELNMWTFAEIERGQHWTLIADREDNEVYAGDVNITGTNPLTNSIYELSSNGDVTSFDNSNPYTSFRIRTAPSKLYVVRHSSINEDAPVSYGMFSNIIVGDNSINLTQVNQALTKTTASVPEGASYTSVDLKAYLVANDYTSPYRIGNFYAGNGSHSLTINYPGLAFPSYYAEIGYGNDDIEYYSGRNNSIFEITDLANTVSFGFANENLTYNASGDFDFLTTTFLSESEESAWSLILPEGTGKVIPTLDVPNELKTFELPVFGSPKQYTVYELEEIEGYNGLKAFVSTSTRSIDAFFEDGKNYTEISRRNLAPSGGRSKASKIYSLRTALKK